MNKRIALFIVSVLSFQVMNAVPQRFAKLVLVDVEKLMTDTREGREMLMKSQMGKDELMKMEYEKSKELSELRSKLEEGMRSGKMTQAELQIESEKMGRMQREAKYELECKREDLMMDARKREFAFKNKILAAAKEYFGKEGGVAVLNKSSAGIIFASNEADRTAELQKVIDEKHEKDRLTLAMTKQNPGNKQA